LPEPGAGGEAEPSSQRVDRQRGEGVCARARPCCCVLRAMRVQTWNKREAKKRKACNAAQRGAAFSLPHTQAVWQWRCGQGSLGPWSEPNDTKEDACAPAASKSTKAGEERGGTEGGIKHACHTCPES
jgi:hypothetical protein